MTSLALVAMRTIKILPITLFAGFLWTGCSYSGATTQLGIGIEATSGTSEFSVLAGYGEWANIAPYGQVWRPYVMDGWRPFSDGHWAWTSAGWTWVSYEPYGWLVYHYGDWDYDPVFGWFWIPGTVWSPARVRWYTYGGYVGWAPIGPRGAMWTSPWEQARFDAWVFVPLHDFDRDDVGRYRVAEPRYGRRPYDHRSGFHAPRFGSVRRAANHPIPRFDLQRKPVRMGNHDYSRIVLPPGEKQKVEKHRSEFRRDEAPPQTLRPIPEQRRPESQQPPAVYRGRRNQNDHTGRQYSGSQRARDNRQGRSQAGERSRDIPRFHSQIRKPQQNQGQSQANPHYRGQNSQRQHNLQRNPGRNRHSDPHREHQRRQHPKTERRKNGDGRLL